MSNASSAVSNTSSGAVSSSLSGGLSNTSSGVLSNSLEYSNKVFLPNGRYKISLSRGRTNNRYLSINDQGWGRFSVVMTNNQDIWDVTQILNTRYLYHIRNVAHDNLLGVNACSGVKGIEQNSVIMLRNDDNSGRQQWTITPTSSKTSYNLSIVRGRDLPYCA